MLNGAEILIECLLEQQTDTVFGYPGAAVMPVYGALPKYRGLVTHYLTAHEQGAAHAADGYARSTGRPGVCLATSGPGATNLVTGIAAAYMDSSPVVAITGNVALPLLGKDSFQEVDIAGITMPITKHNYIVKDIAKLAGTVRSAFHVALSGRPGPVLVDILKDVLEQKYPYEYKAPAPVEKITAFDPSDIDGAAALVNKAGRPVILSGGGVVLAEATAEVVALAEKIHAPVCVTAMGIGGFPSSHALFAGMAGLHGVESANQLLEGADLVIAIGTRFSDRTVCGPLHHVLHIDADAAEIDKNIPAACAIIGDAKFAIKILNKKVHNRAEWVTISDGTSRSFIFDEINRLKGNAIVTTEVGSHQMGACRALRVNQPRGFITSGGLGAMGFGLPAAVGAAVGNPGVNVINIAGDGCFRMNCIELATAVENNLPVTTIIFNNHALGMVNTPLESKKTDFIKLSEAYGAQAYGVTDEASFTRALTDALHNKKTNVINCEI